MGKKESIVKIFSGTRGNGARNKELNKIKIK